MGVPSDLIILSVADEMRTRLFLLEFFTILEMHERVGPALRYLPARFANLDLEASSEALRQVRVQGWFAFRVEPSARA